MADADEWNGQLSAAHVGRNAITCCAAVVSPLRITYNTGSVKIFGARGGSLPETIHHHFDCRTRVYDQDKDQLGEEHGLPFDRSTEVVRDVCEAKVKVWVYYNRTTQEITLNDTEAPESFGRREDDVGPIELDHDLIKSYTTAKAIWYEAHAAFMATVKAATADR